MLRDVEHKSSLAILLLMTLGSISLIASISLIIDFLNETFLLRTVIHWINLCSAIFCIVLIYSRVNSNVIFISILTLSAHQFYFLEKIINKPHYKIFPDTSWYLKSAQDFISDYTHFFTVDRLPDSGFTAVVALPTALLDNIDLINYFVMVLNLIALSISFILIQSLSNLRQHDKRLVSAISVFLPGLQIYPAFMLKESIFCLIISLFIYYLLSRNLKFLSLLFISLSLLFRPAYSLILMFFLTVRQKRYIAVILLIGLIFGLSSNIPIIIWAQEIASSVYGQITIDVLIVNFIYSFFFPSPSMSAEGNLLSTVYSYGSVMFYTFLPLYVSTFFTRKFPSELRYIYLAISISMFVLGIGLFRAKIVLFPIFLILLSTSIEDRIFYRRYRFVISYAIMISMLLLLFLSNFS